MVRSMVPSEASPQMLGLVAKEASNGSGAESVKVVSSSQPFASRTISV